MKHRLKMPSLPSVEELSLARTALKRLALDPRCRNAFLSSEWFGPLFLPAAQRYLLATDRSTSWPRLQTLRDKGFRVGLEYVGEEVTDPAEVEQVMLEYEALLNDMERVAVWPQLGFDLSAVGLLVAPALAHDNTARLLELAATKGVDIILSMERSTLTDPILEIFHTLAPKHPNIGLTLQAQLHRTPDDLAAVVATGRKIRLVKGVYNELADVALPRGQALDDRYVQLLTQALEGGARTACATQDEDLLQRMTEAGLLQRVEEVEMLHGVQPHVLRRLRQDGLPCRISAVYGTNWLLHVIHRIAEHPTNMLQALADLADPQRIVFAADY
jgi:proline dehydrogenase